MKKLRWFILAIILAVGTNFQAISQEDEVFTIVDDMPEYPGGIDSLKNFIAENINYPAEAKSKGIQGRVYVSFTVSKEGKVTDVVVVKGVHSLLDAESIRVVKKMPAWQPGKKDGKPVNVRYTLPVIFKLGDMEKDL